MTSIPVKDERQEAQGVVTVEIQACSLPVVAMRNDGISDAIIDGKTGFLVPLNDEEACKKRDPTAW